MGKENFNGVFFIYGSDTGLQDVNYETDNRFEPNADLIAKKDIVEVYIDLPGVKIENLNVYIRENDLVIEGRKDFEKKSPGIKYIIMESRSSIFMKVIRLPFVAKYEDCTARLKDGVLKIRLFKRLQQAPHT